MEWRLAERRVSLLTAGKTADPNESIGDLLERRSDALERLVTAGKTDDSCEIVG